MQRAAKIARLPVSFHLKQRLAATVFATKAVCGVLINGRIPSAELQKSFLCKFNLATKCDQFSGGRASLGLRRALLLGHTSDLSLYAALRLIRGSFQWFQWTQRFAQNLTTVLRPLGRGASAAGVTHQDPLKACTFGCSLADVDRVLHSIRLKFRLAPMEKWRDASRRDAVIARNSGILVAEQSVD